MSSEPVVKKADEGSQSAGKTSVDLGMVEADYDFVIDPVKEHKMMRKFDLYSLLLMGLMYMFCNLDRGNIGNANIAGMSKDLKLVGNQFGTAVTLLYATYVPFELPSSVLLKVIGPKPLLAFFCTCWAVVTLGMGFIHDWRGLYACRLLLGAFESGLIPCLETYVAMVYKREERGMRIVFVYLWSTIASAFGGLLAFGLTQIHGPHGFAGWRWLFIVEGVLSLLLVPIFLWIFPNDVLNAWFLTDEEKVMMKHRYLQNPSWGMEEKFSLVEVLKIFKDPKLLCFVVMLYSGDLTIFSFTTFLPSILNGMGYTSIHANLLTVPVYIWALIVFLAAGLFSDYKKVRSIPIGFGFLSCIIGYAMLIGVESVGVRYFACYIAMGIYPVCGLLVMWIADTVARHYKRASMIGCAIMFSNTSGVVSGQIFKTKTAPRYIEGLSICMGLACLAFAMCIGLSVAFRIVNKRRDEKIAKAAAEGNPLQPRPELGDYDVFYRYTF